MTSRVVVPYEHDQRDLQTIYLAVTAGATPKARDWKPAFRDVINGRRVVWARFATSGTPWLRDLDGDRKAQAMQVTESSARVATPRQTPRPRRPQAAASTTTPESAAQRLRPTRVPRPAAGQIKYPHERWEATLRAPKEVRGRGPHLFVVDVVGNTDLYGVPIQLRIEPRDKTVTGWYPATWLTTDANRGTCQATVTNPPGGLATVVVRPNAAGQQPTLYAGRIVIQ